jgi:hypothetical protein
MVQKNIESVIEKGSDQSFVNELERKKKMVDYLGYLADILNKQDGQEKDLGNSFIRELHFHIRFWQNFEDQHNAIFPQKIDLSHKINKLKKEIEDETHRIELGKIDENFVQSQVTVNIEENFQEQEHEKLNTYEDEVEETLLQEDIEEIEKEKQRIQVE